MTDAMPQPPAAERWLPVTLEGYGDYEVSDLGRMRSWKKLRGRRGRVLIPQTNPKGYETVRLTCGGKVVAFAVHRLVMLAFVGPRPPEMQIRHLDGMKANNALSNLTYGTAAENTHDKAVHGGYWQSNKTHCKHDHEFTPENTYIRPNGSRGCKVCGRIRYERKRLRRKLARAAAA